MLTRQEECPTNKGHTKNKEVLMIRKTLNGNGRAARKKLPLFKKRSSAPLKLVQGHMDKSTTLKLAADSIMSCACFAASEPGRLALNDGASEI